jgi:hypothetical protein
MLINQKSPRKAGAAKPPSFSPLFIKRGNQVQNLAQEFGLGLSPLVKGDRNCNRLCRLQFLGGFVVEDWH